MKDLRCDICGGEGPITVYASPFGPWSTAYCEECLKVGAEDYFAVVIKAAIAGGRDKVEDWIEEIIAGTLQRTGISPERFNQDVAEKIKLKEARGLYYEA